MRTILIPDSVKKEVFDTFPGTQTTFVLTPPTLSGQVDTQSDPIAHPVGVVYDFIEPNARLEIFADHLHVFLKLGCVETD
jgi:hypothetical protein